jgi:hypothetical protein
MLPTRIKVELDLGFPFNFPLIKSFIPFIELVFLKRTTNKTKHVFKKDKN